MPPSPGSARTTERLHHSHGTSDKARNERQKAMLLTEVAHQRDEAAARLCAESGQLIAESKARIARAQKRQGAEARRIPD